MSLMRRRLRLPVHWNVTGASRTIPHVSPMHDSEDNDSDGDNDSVGDEEEALPYNKWGQQKDVREWK